jgi:hypothetical protein
MGKDLERISSSIIRMTLDDKNIPKNSTKFSCEICNFKSSRKSQYDLHLLTAKHKMMTVNDKNPSNLSKHVCSCGKIYKYRQGLHKHAKSCSQKPVENTMVVGSNGSSGPNDVLFELLKQNQEFKELIVEQNKQLIELAREPKTITNNNTNNNTNNFNLHFFLNTTCKNAISADEFVENIQISFDDLENVGNSGYVKGITDIIMKQLRTLELTERPFHCTDVKRETIYIKEADAWNKDNEEKSKMKTVIGKVARKNLCKIKEWNREHPDVNVLDSKDYEMGHKIIRQSFGDGEDDKLQIDVVKNLVKEVRVDKK